MKKRLLTGIITAGLVLSMATPAFATTQVNTTFNFETSFTQEGATKGTIQDMLNSITSNPTVPKLNMKLFDVMTLYYELMEKYNSATSQSDKKAVLNELTEIVDAIHEVIPDLTLIEYDNIINNKSTNNTTLTDYLSFFERESTQLGLNKSLAPYFVNGKLVKPELKLDNDKVQEYNTKLSSIKTIYTNATTEQKKSIKDTLTFFQSTLESYKNNETVLVTLNSVFSGVETEITKDTQTAVASFSDVTSKHWAYNDIMTIVNKGAVAGTTTPVNGVGTYNPDGEVTLGQFLAISTRLVASDYLDTVEANSNHWASKNYQAALESGLISKYDFKESQLNNAISRQDMAYILVNVAKANGETLKTTSGIQNNISDYNSISQSRQAYVLQAYSNGLLAGKGSGKFDPQGNATRAQIAAVFCRVMNYVERPSVSVDNPSTPPVSSGYVSTAGETKGMLLSAYSREYEHQALQAVRTGSDSKGVYVTFTAPQLPTEIKDSFTFNFTAIPYKSNGDYFTKNVEANLKSGESQTIYLATFEGGSVSKSDIGSMTIGVMINNKDNKHMFVRSIENTDKTSAYGVWYDSQVDKTSLDSSAVWVGIGK